MMLKEMGIKLHEYDMATCSRCPHWTRLDGSLSEKKGSVLEGEREKLKKNKKRNQRNNELHYFLTTR